MPRLIVFVLVLSLSYAGLLRAQSEPSDDPWLKITVSNASCRLILSRPDTAEATPEPEATPDSPTPE
ncbi:MAG: hypothetical protein JNM70_20525, partial [Anaerolineae bacterium]|nr:hypothetical protein [Anaerolineae bacterium]